MIIDKDDSGNYIAKTVVAHKPTEPPSGNGDNYRLENWLFYGGTGGGGGNFGIVTEYTMKDLPHAPNYSYLAKIEIPWEQSPGVIFSETQMYALLKIIWASTDKDNAVPNSEHRFLQWFLHHQDAGKMECILQVNYSATGDKDAIDKECESFAGVLQADVFDKLKNANINFTEPTVANLNAFDACILPDDNTLPEPNQSIQHETWLQGVETNSGIGPGPNSRRQTRSLFMTNSASIPDCFSPVQASTLHRYLTTSLDGRPSGEDPQKSLSSFRWQIDVYGKKVHENKGNLTSFAHRDAWLLMSARSVWYDANKDQQYLGYTNGIFDAFTGGLLPIPSSDPRYQGGYVNYPDNTWGDWQNKQTARYMQVYYMDTADHQRQAKHALDPFNFFVHTQGIY